MAHSDEYKKVLQDTREQKADWGNGLADVLRLKTLLRKRDKTVLDYGSGLGRLKKAAKGLLEVTNYDPSIPGIDVLPDGPFEAVVSRHVLEHIEPEFLVDTLVEIRERVKHLAYFTIPHHEARQWLTDGRNAHLIIESREWWQEQLNAVFPPSEWIHKLDKTPSNALLVTHFIIIRKPKV